MLKWKSLAFCFTRDPCQAGYGILDLSTSRPLPLVLHLTGRKTPWNSHGDVVKNHLFGLWSSPPGRPTSAILHRNHVVLPGSVVFWSDQLLYFIRSVSS